MSTGPTDYLAICWNVHIPVGCRHGEECIRLQINVNDVPLDSLVFNTLYQSPWYKGGRSRFRDKTCGMDCWFLNQDFSTTTWFLVWLRQIYKSLLCCCFFPIYALKKILSKRRYFEIHHNKQSGNDPLGANQQSKEPSCYVTDPGWYTALPPLSA